MIVLRVLSLPLVLFFVLDKKWHTRYYSEGKSVMTFTLWVFLVLIAIDRFSALSISSDLLLFIVLVIFSTSLGYFYGFRDIFHKDVKLVKRLLRLK